MPAGATTDEERSQFVLRVGKVALLQHTTGPAIRARQCVWSNGVVNAQ